MQRAGDREVVDVMACLVAARAVLSPAGHAAEHQRGPQREQPGGAEPQPFHHAGTKALDRHVGMAQQFARGRESFRRAQVECEASAATHRRAALHLRRARPLDARDPRAHVGEQHRGEGDRAQARELHDPQAAQGAGGR